MDVEDGHARRRILNTRGGHKVRHFPKSSASFSIDLVGTWCFFGSGKLVSFVAKNGVVPPNHSHIKEKEGEQNQRIVCNDACVQVPDCDAGACVEGESQLREHDSDSRLPGDSVPQLRARNVHDVQCHPLSKLPRPDGDLRHVPHELGHQGPCIDSQVGGALKISESQPRMRGSHESDESHPRPRKHLV